MNLDEFINTHGIVPELRKPDHRVPSIGFSEKEQKWYGWSHRAIYGFGVGSVVKKGDCGYTADNPEEMIDDYANFYLDISQDCADKHRAECQVLPDRSGIRILHAPLNIPMAASLEEAISSIYDDDNTLPIVNIAPDFSIQKCGRGEWTAQTLGDAKQMACDFAAGVA